MFALLITNIWSKTKYLYPVVYDTFEDADKAYIPQRNKNNIIEVVQCDLKSGWKLIKT